MAIRWLLLPLAAAAISLALSLPSFAHSTSADPYKVLGIEKSASQRDIQKAFHKLSLKYHPDKNKSKSAQEKFAEINNAYEILSDEEKRKNYDLYGDEKPNPGFESSNFHNQEGYSYFTGGGPGGSFFSSGANGWQGMGGQGSSRSFSYSFGGGRSGASGDSSGFSFSDIFSNLFGDGATNEHRHGGFGGFSGFGGQENRASALQDITEKIFTKQISDKGLTWILLYFTPHTRGYYELESLIEDITISLDGAIKAGRINCENERILCQRAGVSLGKSARVFVHSYGNNGKESLVEYDGSYDSRSLKAFCQSHLPRVSKHVSIDQFSFPSNVFQSLPQVLLLTTKKDTPVIWRAIAGLYRSQFALYDAEVHDVSHPFLKRLGVKKLPCVVGRTVDGEELILKDGIVVKDLKSGIAELKSLLESFEKRSRKSTLQKDKKESRIPLVTASNFDEICGEKSAVCIFGVFRSSNAREQLKSVLFEVSQKTLSRRQSGAVDTGGSLISYSLLDAKAQSGFLSSLEKSGFGSKDTFLIAYKPRKGKFAASAETTTTMEEAEKFVASVLNGDLQFSKVRGNPVLR